jgi:hypothetical protein
MVCELSCAKLQIEREIIIIIILRAQSAENTNERDKSLGTTYCGAFTKTLSSAGAAPLKTSSISARMLIMASQKRSVQCGNGK